MLFTYASQPVCAVYFHMPTFWWKHAQEHSNFKIKMWKLVRFPFNQLFSICEILDVQKLREEHDEQMEWWYLRVVVGNSYSPWFFDVLWRCLTLSGINLEWKDQGEERFKREAGWLNIRNFSLEHFCRRLKDWSNSYYGSYQKESQEYPLHTEKFSGRKRLFKLVERSSIWYSTGRWRKTKLD